MLLLSRNLDQNKLMIKQIFISGLDSNFSYVIHDKKEAAIVDPSGDIEKVFDYVGEENLEVVKILITHTHHDHIDQLEKAQEQYPNAQVIAHGLAKNVISADQLVEEGDIIGVGDLSLQVFYTPGHCSSSVCFYCESEKWVVTGDTLFVNGCGRVFDGKKVAEELWKSLQRLTQLPEETTIYPGHDYGPTPRSTIGWEKQNNRFLQGDLQNFLKERLS